MFFTKTINRYTTVRFTVTGIGQVTVTTVKYEKEYITRCNKKGYGGGHHRREAIEEDGIESDLPDVPVYRTKEPGLGPRPPPGLPWDTPRYPLRAGTDISPSGVVESQETLPPVIQNAFRGSSPFRPNNSAWPRTRPRHPVRIGRSAELEEDQGLTGSPVFPESETSQPHPPLLNSPSGVVG